MVSGRVFMSVPGVKGKLAQKMWVQHFMVQQKEKAVDAHQTLP